MTNTENNYEHLLRLIDEGVPVDVAANVCQIELSSLSSSNITIIKKRAADTRAKVMKNLYRATQKVSASPNSVASAAQAWIKLTNEETKFKEITESAYDGILSDNEINRELENLRRMVDDGNIGS